MHYFSLLVISNVFRPKDTIINPNQQIYLLVAALKIFQKSFSKSLF